MTWMQTASGKEFDFLVPRADMIDIDDIAVHLSRICRFNGASSRFYSVAEHSLHVSNYAERELGLTPIGQLAALLHDAHEAYCGDVSSPVKQVLGEVWFLFEHRLQRVVLKELRVWTAYTTHAKAIKQADLALLANERYQLMPAGRAWECLHGIEQPSTFTVDRTTDFTFDDWARAFIDRYTELRHRVDEQLGQVDQAAAPQQPAPPNHDALVQLAQDLLNPEVFGHAVTDEVRRHARRALHPDFPVPAPRWDSYSG